MCILSAHIMVLNVYVCTYNGVTCSHCLFRLCCFMFILFAQILVFMFILFVQIKGLSVYIFTQCGAIYSHCLRVLVIHSSCCTHCAVTCSYLHTNYEYLRNEQQSQIILHTASQGKPLSTELKRC